MTADEGQSRESFWRCNCGDSNRGGSVGGWFCGFLSVDVESAYEISFLYRRPFASERILRPDHAERLREISKHRLADL